MVESQLQLLDVVDGDGVQGIGPGILNLEYKCMENSSLVPVSPAWGGPPPWVLALAHPGEGEDLLRWYLQESCF